MDRAQRAKRRPVVRDKRELSIKQVNRFGKFLLKDQYARLEDVCERIARILRQEDVDILLRLLVICLAQRNEPARDSDGAICLLYTSPSPRDS